MNTVPSNYPRPDPATTLAGEPASDPQGQRILDASNWHSAAPRCAWQPLAWNYTDDPCQRSAVLPAMPAVGAFGSHVALAHVPAYGARTDIEVYAYGRRDGATGTIRFRSVYTGNTVDLAFGAADGWTAIGSLTLDTSSGWDWVEIYLAGDGAGGDVHLWVAAGDFPALSGALAAPSSADEPTPFDEAELEPDEPWSSDVSYAVEDNLEIFLAWTTPVMTWSGIQNTSTGAKASHTMPEWDHTVLAHVHRGQKRGGLTWSMRAFVQNVSGADELVSIYLGGPAAAAGEGFPLTVAGPAGGKFVTGTARPTDIGRDGAEVRRVEGVEHPTVFITVMGNRQLYTTAGLRALSIWGV